MSNIQELKDKWKLENRLTEYFIEVNKHINFTYDGLEKRNIIDLLQSIKTKPDLTMEQKIAVIDNFLGELKGAK